MRLYRLVLLTGLFLALKAPALASDSCAGYPNAIGTSRTIAVDPNALPHIGTMQYRQSLPLKDHEVVLTFDDGPLPPYTNRVLDILAANCVKANYFLVGQMAKLRPDLVRRIYNSGHVIGTHSLHHPMNFSQLSEQKVAAEVEGGIAAVAAALGDPRAVAPFFRIPGLYRSKAADAFLASKSLTVFSVDEIAYDWRPGIAPQQIAAIAMRRIEAKRHRGILLLHDIHPVTLRALPLLLRQLQENGYRIVQAVPAGERPASVATLPKKPMARWCSRRRATCRGAGLFVTAHPDRFAIRPLPTGELMRERRDPREAFGSRAAAADGARCGPLRVRGCLRRRLGRSVRADER